MKIVLGDMVQMAFDGKLDVIIQGCNCFCRMGRGLAKTISERIPEAVEADNQTTRGDRSKLGSYSVGYHSTDNDHTFAMVNAYTQYHWDEPKDEVLVDYDALRMCLRKIRKEFRTKRIGIPLIGADLARGDWKLIERIILQELAGCDVTIVQFQERDPEALFAELLAEMQFSSNASAVLESKTGQALIRQGGHTIWYMFQKNVPLNAHTMYLLGSIVEGNPFPPTDAGKITNMARAWRAWAKDNGYA